MERIGGPRETRSRSPEHADPPQHPNPSIYIYKKNKNKAIALVVLNTGGFHVCATVGFLYD
jgi:hypothetical protein